jgi:ribosomal protein S18 acetylase RimI-like enzyme
VNGDDVRFRPSRPDDLDRLKEIMVEAFEGVSIDQGMEAVYGAINGHDWKWRKARHLDEDLRRDPEGVIVAEERGQILGFVSTWIDREAGIGHIPNLSLIPAARGRGLGRELLVQAMNRFREKGVSHAKIETLVQNAVGNRLYPSLGFREVARQVHFVAALEPPSDHDPQASGAA